MDYKAKTGQVIWRVAMLLALSGAIMAAGSVWTVVTSPNAGTTNFLYSVAAISAFDVWAIGYDYDASNRQFTLIEHWDGAKWSIVKSPNVPGADKNFLNGVAMVSPTDVWAVGYSEEGVQGTIDAPLIEHYDGRSWSILASPFPKPSQFNALYGIT